MPKPANPIPPGFHTVTPHLNVKDAAAYSDFLQRAFGAVEIARSPGPGGKLMHAEVRIGDSTLMFADHFPNSERPPTSKAIIRFTSMSTSPMSTAFGRKPSRRDVP